MRDVTTGELSCHFYRRDPMFRLVFDIKYTHQTTSITIFGQKRAKRKAEIAQFLNF